MVFSYNNTSDDFTIKIRNTLINKVDSGSFLVLTIDDKVKFTNRVNKCVVEKLSRTVGALYKMSSVVPPNVHVQKLYIIFCFIPLKINKLLLFMEIVALQICK